MGPLTMVGRDVRYLVSGNTGLKIPVISARGLVFSAWVPTPEDLELFKRGQPLWLVQRGEAIPEMHMIVGNKDQVIPAEIRRDSFDATAPTVTRQAEIEVLVERWGPLVGQLLIPLVIGLAVCAVWWITS